MDTTPQPLTRTTRHLLTLAVVAVGLAITAVTAFAIRQTLSPLLDDPVGLAAPLLTGERPENLLAAVVIVGTLLSVTLGLVTWRLGLVYNRLIEHNQTLRDYRDRDRRALQNGQIEKQVLHQALADSEQRTRDFLAIGEAVAFELDDEGRIGFLSPQIQQWIDNEPVALAHQPFQTLFKDDSEQAIRDLFRACRHGNSASPTDVQLLAHGGSPVTVRLCMVPVLDRLESCQGFRGLFWASALD